MLVEGRSPAVEPRNVVREYLQARILESLQHSGAMGQLAFHGGTALRFLFGIPRYSEDLDFALERDEGAFDLRRSLRGVRRALVAEAYAVEVVVDVSRTVHAAMIRFPGLLFELGASSHANQVLSIKVEVDTRPPFGAGLSTSVVNRHRVLNLQHHDRPSLLAGKIHALLQRRWTKGRDLYDLLWYLSDPGWPGPNLVMLEAALAQTGWTGPAMEGGGWQRALADRLGEVDWREATDDVRRFVEPGVDVAVLTEEILLGAVRGRG
jgi:hypothetical protein